MKRVHLTAVFAVTLATLFGVSLQAVANDNLYRWTDEEGNQFNSDRPPPAGVEYEVISTRSSMVRKLDGDPEAESANVETSDQDAEPVHTASRTTVEKNPELCARARDNLAQLDTRARIRLRNDEGEVRFLTEDEREHERDKAIGAIESYCD